MDQPSNKLRTFLDEWTYYSRQMDEITKLNEKVDDIADKAKKQLAVIQKKIYEYHRVNYEGTDRKGENVIESEGTVFKYCYDMEKAQPSNAITSISIVKYPSIDGL